MKNKFRIGEIVVINGKGKIYEEPIKSLAIIDSKDYFFNEYFVTILVSKKQDWFEEKDIERVMEADMKKQQKYKVALAIENKGLDMIEDKIKKMPNKNNNILNKVDFIHEYKIDKKRYTILIWTSTYWSENNFAVKCIEDTLKQLRKMNIAYKQIIIGETDPTHVKVNEFIKNDKNVNIFKIFQKIEIKNMGGILV